MSSSLPSLVPNEVPPQKAKVTRGHSCVLCRRRKIKCDGQRPCQNCQKSRNQCVAAEFAPSKRRKLKDEDLSERLKRAEHALREAGLKIDDDKDDGPVTMGEESEHGSNAMFETGSGTMSRKASPVGDGKLIVEKGQSRYIESSVWGHINTEVREDSIHLLQHSSEDETVNEISVSDYGSLLFGRLLITNSVTAFHPPPVQIFRLWQIFLNNVNLVTKIIHASSVQELLLQGMGDIDSVSAPTEALMLAIYHSAAVSLDEQECQSVVGESRVSALAKFSTGTQQALINAKLLRTSNLLVLQALVLYLLSIREVTDHDTMWVLYGVATKIARRMGLHRDSGPSALSILEAEIRKRVWWQILAIEGQSSFYSGSSESGVIPRPARVLNVNDSDLSTSMREPPVEQSAITEMLFCCVGYEIGNFMYHRVLSSGSKPNCASYGTEQLMSTLKAIDELENNLHEKYFRYCDLSVPLHYLTNIVVHGAISKIRLRFYTAARLSSGPPQPQAEKDAAFNISLKLLEIDNKAHTGEGKTRLKGFMWHVRLFFQLEAFVYTLSELRIRTVGPQVDIAWKLVESAYCHHDQLSRGTKDKLWFAVGNLCLKAWEQRIKSLCSQLANTHVTVPECVRKLYAQRGVKDGLNGALGSQNMPAMEVFKEFSFPSGDMAQSGNMPSKSAPFDIGDVGSIDWQYWQTLFEESEVLRYG